MVFPSDKSVIRFHFQIMAVKNSQYTNNKPMGAYA